MTTTQDWERRRKRWAEWKAQQKDNAMTHDDTRDNITAIEDTIVEADEREGWFRNQTAEYYEHHTDYDCP